MQASFKVLVNHKDLVLIEDTAGREVHPSVTNSIEWVVGLLVTEDIMHEPQRLFYIDSFGEMDEAVWNIGEGFEKFRHPDFDTDLVAHEALVFWEGIKLKRKRK